MVNYKMELTTNRIKSIAMIGFDTLKGPVVEWEKNFSKDFQLDINQFCTPFYLMFQSGNGIKPRAIFYEEFSVVAFSEDMNLLLLFLDNEASKKNYDALLKFAKDYYPKTSTVKIKERSVKEQMIDLLREQQKMTISELRNYFKYNRKTIRRYLLDLVLSGKVKRDGKKGHEIIWAVQID